MTSSDSTLKYNKFKQALENLQETLDDNKQDMSDEVYKSLIEGLHKMYKIKDNGLYEIEYLCSEYSHAETNVYGGTIKKYTKIVKLSNEEYEQLDSELRNSNNFLLGNRFNSKLFNILKKLFGDGNTAEIIGMVNQEDCYSEQVSIKIKSKVIFTGLRKL